MSIIAAELTLIDENTALRARVAKLEEERDRYLMNGLEADRRCKELRARVAKLEVELADARKWILAALKDAPK